jgi:transcriptional regulator with PAS, ATPase and Fis domain
VTFSGEYLRQHMVDFPESKAMGRPIRNIHKHMVELSQKYSWPGNVRELQNINERSSGLRVLLDLEYAIEITDLQQISWLLLNARHLGLFRKALHRL